MKTSLTLSALAAELERQQAAKVDYVADTRRIHFTTAAPPVGAALVDGGGAGGISTLDLVGDGATEATNDLRVLPFAHRQIADHVGIPWKYYERLRHDGGGLVTLLDENVNRLFHREPKRRMIRTLDGQARAFLSDGYRRLDNFDLAETIIPVLGEIEDVRFESCALTDSRMYIKALTPRVRGEVKVGEEVCAGVFISNSEVGAGSLRVEPFVYTLACTNGMVVSKGLGAAALRRVHVGRRVQADDGFRVFRDETLAADDRAFFMAAADVVRAAVDEVRFRDLLDAMRQAAESGPVRDAVGAVEQLAKVERLSDGEKHGVLTHLAAGGDLSRWGVLSAVTRQAEDVESYDRATELEELGGKILAYADREWRTIAGATS
jgi:hypothetical protein